MRRKRFFKKIYRYVYKLRKNFETLIARPYNIQVDLGGKTKTI